MKMPFLFSFTKTENRKAKHPCKGVGYKEGVRG
jgi:hypothetical protein